MLCVSTIAKTWNGGDAGWEVLLQLSLVMGCRGASTVECSSYRLHTSLHMLQQHSQRNLSLHTHAAKPTLLSVQSASTSLSCSVFCPFQGMCLNCLTPQLSSAQPAQPDPQPGVYPQCPLQARMRAAGMHWGRLRLSRPQAQSRGCYARHLSRQVRTGSLKGVLGRPMGLSEPAAAAEICPVPCLGVGGLGMLGWPSAFIEQRADDETAQHPAWGGSRA